MTEDIDRRTVLAATGAGMAFGLTDIGSGERPTIGNSVEMVTAGVMHQIDEAKRDLKVWTVDDIPPYMVKPERGEVAVLGHPERNVIDVFQRSDAVTDMRGYQAAAALGSGVDAAREPRSHNRGRRGGRRSERSIVTEFGRQHRVRERVPTEHDYEPPRVEVRPRDSRITLESAEAELEKLTKGEAVSRTLPEREVVVSTRDDGSREVTVTPVLQAQHHGRLHVVEEQLGGGRATSQGGK